MSFADRYDDNLFINILGLSGGGVLFLGGVAIPPVALFDIDHVDWDFGAEHPK